MADDLERRVSGLEDDLEEAAQPKPGRDVIVTIQYYDSILDETTGAMRRVDIPCEDFDEGEWADFGGGDRLRVRRPRETVADHGMILKDTPVTL